MSKEIEVTTYSIVFNYTDNLLIEKDYFKNTQMYIKHMPENNNYVNKDYFSNRVDKYIINKNILKKTSYGEILSQNNEYVFKWYSLLDNLSQDIIQKELHNEIANSDYCLYVTQEFSIDKYISKQEILFLNKGTGRYKNINLENKNIPKKFLQGSLDNLSIYREGNKLFTYLKIDTLENKSIEIVKQALVDFENERLLKELNKINNQITILNQKV